MKNDITKKLAAMIACASLIAVPNETFAKEISFEVIPGVEWKLTVPDEFFAAYEAAPGTNSAPIPTAIPIPTARPTSTPSPSVKPTSAPAATPVKTPSALKPTAQESQMLSWVNGERSKEGISSLTVDEELTRIARLKAQDMIDNSYFAHASPTYGNISQMLKDQGISYLGCGENIARYGNLYKAHVGLMSSAGHRQNILSKSFKNIGIGIVRAKDGAYYIVQVFTR